VYFQFVNNKIKGRRKSDFLCTITDHLNLLLGLLDITTHQITLYCLSPSALYII